MPDLNIKLGSCHLCFYEQREWDSFREQAEKQAELESRFRGRISQVCVCVRVYQDPHACGGQRSTPSLIPRLLSTLGFVHFSPFLRQGL